MITKFALPGLLAAAIALAPVGAAPARAADPHDIIGGALALGIIGAIIANEAKKAEAARAPAYGYHHPPVRYHQPPHRHYRPAPAPLPRNCLRKRWTPRGWVTYYSNACLRKQRYR